MANLICPWWFAYALNNPLRYLVQNPEKVLGPYIRPGMTGADLGCGMGYFTMDMARLVGETGKVFAVDIQQEMLNALNRRARRRGLSERITTVLSEPDSIRIPEEIDFALAFWMVHETPSAYGFFSRIVPMMRDGARVLVAEPRGHVSGKLFQHNLDEAARAGLRVVETPPVRFSRSAVLSK